MDPLTIHHVIRHPLSRIETNNFQDKSGCSINGIRFFLFEQGIVQDIHEIERILANFETRLDYRGYLISVAMSYFNNFPLSDEILKMKNVRFIFQYQSKPNHKLVYPEPHFIEEERNLIENHFSYLAEIYEGDDIEDWGRFEMDNEGHLVSIKSNFVANFQLSNESIEHLSNFPHLRTLDIYSSTTIQDSVTNFSLLTDLTRLSMTIGKEIQDPELFQDLGLFSNLHFLCIQINKWQSL